MVLIAPTPPGPAVSHAGGSEWGPNSRRARQPTPHAWAAPPNLHLHAVLVDVLLPETASHGKAWSGSLVEMALG